MYIRNATFTETMGYMNPLLDLPAGRDLLNLPEADRVRIAKVFRQLRAQANTEAENAWARRKGPMSAYWRAVSTYARHLAHALERGASAESKAIAKAADLKTKEPQELDHA